MSMGSSWQAKLASVDEESEFCAKCASVIEDVVVEGMFSSQQITEAMDDERFFFELREFIRNKFKLNPF